MTLKELRQKRAQQAARGKTLTDEFNALLAKATRTAEDEARLTALETELAELEAVVVDLDRQIDAGEATQRRATLFATPAHIVDPQGRPAARSAGRTVNELNPETTFGFRSLTDFAQSVRRATLGGGHDPRLAAALEASSPAVVNENQGSGGEGFLVPPDFSRTVWEITFEQTDLLGMCAPEPTRSNSVFKPKDEVTPWGAVGVQAVWAAEASTLTATKLAVGGDLMMLHKIYAFTAASDEVLDDAPMLQDRLTRQAGRALRYKISDAIVWGNGVGQPTGFMNAPSLITVAEDAAQPAKTLSVNNILTMASRMLRLGGKPFWIVNQDVIPQLGALTFGTFPAWLPFNQPISGDIFEGRLVGYPVMFSEHAQTLGTLGDITLANLDGYYAATKADGGIDFAQSIHLYFDSGLTAFRWTFRVAGQPYLSAPVAPAHGANTKSHFVALATRA